REIMKIAIRIRMAPMKPVRIPIIQEKTMTERTTMEPIMEHMTKMVIHMVHMMVTTINNLYVRWDSIKGKQFLY
ncbi:MAG: hypothetical protein PHE70_09015, partial [Tepidanaerobacteraceae bacterium]|nr:hypothetical protein [Tepidanaerobacteraceae bacterium]